MPVKNSLANHSPGVGKVEVFPLFIERNIIPKTHSNSFTIILSGDLDALMDWFIYAKPGQELQLMLQSLVLHLESMYDLAKLPEAVFHAFVSGLLANLRVVYDIRSNADSGFERADILMIPGTSRCPVGYVIEFKSISAGEDMEIISLDAISRIVDKQYDAHVVDAFSATKQVRYLAIVLQGKKVVVREQTK